MLPQLGGHGCAPQVGALAPELRPLNCVPQGLAVSGPALHEVLLWQYGRAAQLWRSPRNHWREGVRISGVAPLLAPLWDLGPLPTRRAGAAAPQPWVDVPQRRVLLVEGSDDEAEGSGGHWVGITHDAPSGPPAGRQAPRPAQGHARGRRCGAGPQPAGVRRVVRGAASPRSTAATPAAPVRGERRPDSGGARGPRARGGVAAAPQGAGRVRNALTQVCGH